jgi:hypothetical protein
MCGDSNLQTVAYCHRCSYRLPWADEVEGSQSTTEKQTLAETSALDKVLKRWGLLPEAVLICRYYNGTIDVDTKQCPHCKEWLVSPAQTAKIDPWSSGYKEKDIDRVDIINLRSGCFSILASILMAVTFLWLRP